MGKKTRKIASVFSCVLMLSCILLGINTRDVQAAGNAWTFVDGNLTTGLNYDITKKAVTPVMAVFNNDLYIAWTENNSSTTQIRVRKYDGSRWTWVDGDTNTGINYNASENATSPYLYVFNNNLYAVWNEFSGEFSAIRIKRYDGESTWTSIDGSAENGLNKQSATTSDCPTLGVCNGNLYAAWVESYNGAMQLRVKRYDGGTDWTFVDGGGDSGLNIDPTKSVKKPELYVNNNVLYLVWSEVNSSSKNQIRVKSYDGKSIWTIVDGGGLNYNKLYSVDQAELAGCNGSLYAYWLEYYRVRLKKYDGNAWVTADSNAGFVQNESAYIYSPPSAIPYNNKLYFTWGEESAYSPYFLQCRAGVYTGVMTIIDGNNSMAGLNRDSTMSIFMPKIIEYKGDLYIAWYESDRHAFQIRVKKTSLPAIVNSVTTPTNGYYGAGQNLEFIVNFNKAVNVTGTPTIPITLDSGLRYASYYSGSGTANLVFRYTIAAGDADSDGIVVGSEISLSTGAITDSAKGLDAEVNLNNMPVASGMLVDSVAPTVSSLTPMNGAEDFLCNSNLVINFSENVVKGSGNITIKKRTDESIIETINASGPNVIVSGNTVTIDPSVTLREGEGYFIIIDPTAFHDTAGNNYAGISQRNVWTFWAADFTAPSGYSVQINQPYINSSNQTEMAFTISGAEYGTHYEYTITSNGGGTPVMGGGPISSWDYVLTGISTSGLKDGTLTLSVILTDDAGNKGVTVTDTVIKDTQAPTGYNVAIEEPSINKSNANNLSLVISGAEAGAGYRYSVTSSGGGTIATGLGTVSSGTSKITGINVSGLNDGELTISLIMTDVSGNEGLSVTNMVVKDTGVPKGYSVDIHQGIINKANKTDLGFTVGGAEEGSTYHYLITSSGGGAQVSSTGNIDGVEQIFLDIDVTDLRDGTLTVSVYLTDAAGNSGTAVTDTVLKDTQPPAGYTVSIDQTYINNNNKAAMSFAVSGVEVGSKYMYSVSSSGGGPQVSKDGTIQSITQHFTDVDTSGLNEGTLTVSFVLIDDFANTGEAATDTVVKDTVMPGGYSVDFVQSSVNNSNRNAISFRINGGEAGASFTYMITSSGGGTTVTGNGKCGDDASITVNNVNVTGLHDGTLTIRLRMTDVAGNDGEDATDTVTKDIAAPSGYDVQIQDNKVNNGNKYDFGFSITDAEEGTTYNATLTSSGGGTAVTRNGIVTGLTQFVIGINTAGLSDGTLTLRVTLTDSAGNIGAAVVRTVKKDTIVPTVVLNDSDSDNLVKAGTSVTISATFSKVMANTPTVIIANGVNETRTMTDSGDHKLWRYIWTVPTGDSTASVTVAGTDTAGNAYAGSEGLTFTIDNTTPVITDAVFNDNTHLTVTLSENCKNLTKANNGGFTVRETSGTATYAVTASQKVDDRHVKLTVANMGASGRAGVTVRYTAGTNGTIQDSAGNPMATHSVGVPVAAWDNNAPTLVNAARTDNTHMTVVLSENCINLTKPNSGGFTVSENGTGMNYAVTAIAKGPDAVHVVLTVANMGVSAREGVTVRYTAGGTGTIQDVAGNLLATDSIGVEIPGWDTAGPVISSGTMAVNNTYIDAVFSEGVYSAENGTTGLTASDLALTFAANGGTATDVVINSVKKNNAATAGTASALTGGETTVRVFLTITGTPSGVETIEIRPADDLSIYDKGGNAVPVSVTTGAKNIKDKLRPTLISAVRTDNTHLVMNLSESCINLVKTNNGGFTVVETGNPGKMYVVTRTAQGVDASHIVLTLANIGASGKEGVTVKYAAGTNGTIKDTANNGLATNNTGLSIAAWDLDAPTLVNAVRTDNTHLTVTLSENCINLTKTNNGGFIVSETGTGANYAVTSIAKGADSAHVILTVAHMGRSANEGVTVKYSAGGNGTIQDVAGNAMVTNDIGVSVAAWDTTGPTINSSTLANGNNYIDIVFSEGVYGANNGTTGLTAGDFTLTFAANGGTAANGVIGSVKKNNGSTISTATSLTGGENVVRVFLNVTGTPSGVETIEIKPADGSSIYDKAGNAAPDSVTTDAKVLKDKLPPTLISAVRTDNTHLTVTLSENCKNLIKNNNGGFTVRETGNPGKVYAVTKIVQGADACHVVLTVANMSASSGTGVTVRYSAGTNGTIQDTVGNALVSNSVGVNVASWS